MKSTRFAARHVVRRKDRRAGTPTLLSGAKIPSFPASLRRKTAAAVLGAALGALSALPALAAEDPDDQPSSSNRTPGISFEAPTPAPGAVLTGVQKVVVKVRADEFTVLQALKLSLVSDDPSIPPFVHEVAPKGFDGTRDQTIQLDWNTAQLTPRNGAYKLVAWGKACDFNNCGFDVSENSVSVTGLKVNNAPAAPQGVKAAIQGTAPLVSWVPAPEPDVKRYHVMRTTGGAAQLVGTTTATSFSDPCSDALPCPAGANLAYQVVAVRSSPVSADGVLSAASAAVSVLVPQPAPAPAAAGAASRQKSTVARPPAAAPVAAAPAPAPTANAAPYPQLTDPAPVPPPPADLQPGPAVAKPPVVRDPATTAVQLPKRLEEPRVPKMRYIAIAGALMVLVLAAHIFRGGGLLLGSGSASKRR